ncbi:hypothetical protein J3Q64DRAFT_1776336 [Phycomyces blakesleeanus]|uniref:Coenzyme Q-binding protein COQ10 START domain-containing protein n=1 Tax=Phycomyces blakesleeanus TaxID=4837 RepID=A0ABR3AHX1_PHYBL
MAFSFARRSKQTFSHVGFQFNRTFFSLPDLLSSRKQYSERKLLNFSQKEVYDVVSNVKDYHLFVPFCNASHVYSSTPLGTTGTYIMKAELGVGFKLFEEKYMSQVTCKEPIMVQINNLCL